MEDEKKSEKSQPQRSFGYGRVTEVHSGDSFTIVGGIVDPAVNPVPPTKEIAISGIAAPYFTRNRIREDEPFAWQSREFLRSLINGKQIRFEINIQTAGNRDYAQVYLEHPGKEPEVVAETIVGNGWAKLKENKNPNADQFPERQALIKLQGQAQEKGLGLWNKKIKKHTREIVWGASFMVGTKNSREERNALFESEFQWAMGLKGKELPAVVTRIRDGSTIRCELTKLYPNEAHKHRVILVNLTGVKCPNVPPPLEVQQQMKARRSTYVIQESPPPFALEAQHYVEERLLHQDVNVIIDGADKLGNIYATIKHAKGNISLKLLENCYGLLVPWQASFLSTEYRNEMDAASAAGEAKKLRVCSVEQPKIPDAPPKMIYTATVTEVSSGDSIRLNGDAVKRYSLASLRCPRSGRRGEAPDNYFIEAREFVRKRVFGKKVTIYWAYRRFDQDFINIGYTSKFHQNEIDISEELVREGYAETVIHQAQETRARNYGKLLELETQAKRAHRNLHGDHNSAVTLFDLTNRPAAGAPDVQPTPGKKKAASRAEISVRSATLLKQIKGEKQFKVVVEYCHNGAKFKVFLPDMGSYCYMLNFVCAGVNCAYPKPRGGGPIDIWGMKALNLARNKLLHQDNVHIRGVEMKDKGDNFLGRLYVGKLDWGLYLITQGLASVRYDPSGEMWQAQEAAKEAKKGLWKDWVPPEPEEPTEKQNEEVEVKNIKQTFDGTVTEILDATTCFIRAEGDENVEKITSVMKSFEGKSSADFPPAEGFMGLVCAGKYGDGTWHRVRIAKKTRSGYSCTFIDFGNSGELKSDLLAPLPDDLIKIPATAKRYILAGIKCPSENSAYAHPAIRALDTMSYEAILTVNVEDVDGNKVHVSLTPKGHETTINAEMVKGGWVRVMDRPLPKLKDFCKKLRKDEQIAKNRRLNIWEYGDVSDDEDEDVPAWRETGRPPSLAKRRQAEKEKKKEEKKK